jgi:hypothetical protein
MAASRPIASIGFCEWRCVYSEFIDIKGFVSGLDDVKNPSCFCSGNLPGTFRMVDDDISSARDKNFQYGFDCVIK